MRVRKSDHAEKVELRWIDKGWVKGGDELRIVFGANNSRPPISISRTAMENLAGIARSKAQGSGLDRGACLPSCAPCWTPAQPEHEYGQD